MTRTSSTPPAPGAQSQGQPVDETLENPWPALWAIVLGFFMLLVDTSILTVATPAIMESLETGVNEVIWVTSAYLLAYVVPLLIMGRLGDRFGPKRIYLLGLVVFTAASLWCGLADSIEMLIVARVVQGIGAAMVSPQTMAIITRIFPRERRGQAMALWGAAAGLATLVGPLLGGVLVEHLGWAWIFFVNIPVGIVGFVLAVRLVPELRTHPHQLDWVGVTLFGLGMFSLVLGIQEAGEHGWGQVFGRISVAQLVVAGVGLLSLFIFTQSRNSREPLMPLTLFADRNFSTSTFTISLVSFSFTAMGFPLMMYAQLVRGWSPIESSLLMAPLAIASGLLARRVGLLTDKVHPRLLVGAGAATGAVAMALMTWLLTPDVEVWLAVVLMAMLGIGAACLWGPLSASANRNLPLHQAGAGAGVYNTTRQIGAVLGSAAAALLLDARLRAHGLGGVSGGPETAAATGGGALPPELAEAWTSVFRETLAIVPAALTVAFVAALFLELPRHLQARPGVPAAGSSPDGPARDVPHIVPSPGGVAGNPKHPGTP